MAKPVLVKLGGSVLTDRSRGPVLRRPVARRLIAEVARAGLPTVLLHGAGGYGHPVAARFGVGTKPLVGTAGATAASEILAAVGMLQAEVVALAAEAGLRPLAVPLHLTVQGEGGGLAGMPVDEIRALLDAGHAPVMGGTLVRDDRLGWRVLSADEILAVLAAELGPRLALFATDVDGVMEGAPDGPHARVVAKVTPRSLPATPAGPSADVTGGMGGKLVHAFQAAQSCPTLIVNGLVRGRVLQALKGKDVVGTIVSP